MGRSQLKYRATRGRGQGDSSRGGRGGSARHTGGRRANGARALESNAFRYEERDDDAGDGANDPVERVPDNSRRQFFADEKKYRDMGESKEAYFRTKAMQQWDLDEDEDESVGASSGAVGVMDFIWVAEQLAAVPLSVRYQIDTKYCVDSVIDSPKTEESPAEVTTAQDAPTAVARVTASASAYASALDELLALSSSAAGQPTASVPTTSSGSVPMQSTQAFHSSADPETLEDWLDDVLDM